LGGDIPGPGHDPLLADESACPSLSETGQELYTAIYTRKINNNNKAKFFEAFNCIFGKVGRIASEQVIFALIKSKCLPVLLYGTEACPINSALRHSLQFALNRALLKIFGALSVYIYACIM